VTSFKFGKIRDQAKRSREYLAIIVLEIGVFRSEIGLFGLKMALIESPKPAAISLNHKGISIELDRQI